MDSRSPQRLPKNSNQSLRISSKFIYYLWEQKLLGGVLAGGGGGGGGGVSRFPLSFSNIRCHEYTSDAAVELLCRRNR